MNTGPPMLQHPDELAQLLELYRVKRPRRVLELGVGEGGTLYHWLRLAPPGAVVVAIDLHHQAADQYPGWTPAGVTVVAIAGDSNHPATAQEAGVHAPYDWVFIDADHHEPNVRVDWGLYASLASPGAVIALHDVAPTDDPTVEVDRLWAELRAEHNTIEIVEPGGFGIGVVVTPTRASAAVGA